MLLVEKLKEGIKLFGSISKVKKSLVQSFQDCDQMYQKIRKCIFGKDLLVGLGLHISLSLDYTTCMGKFKFYFFVGQHILFLFHSLPGVTNIDHCTQQTAPRQPEYERELAVQTCGLFPSNQTVCNTDMGTSFPDILNWSVL